MWLLQKNVDISGNEISTASIGIPELKIKFVDMDGINMPAKTNYD